MVHYEDVVSDGIAIAVREHESAAVVATTVPA
jgi:hypothetical protein